MDQQTYNSLKAFIWGIANDCLVDVYDVGDYRKIILPMLVIRRFDAVLEPKHDAVMAMKKKMEAKGTLELLQTQLDGTLQYINSLKNSQQQADIYFHDLRHHFRLIFGYASAKDCKAITDYISRMEKSIEAVSPLLFCKNDALNLILSAFQSKAEKEGISLDININMTDKPPIPDIELCAIFSNGLENAIKATRDITGRPKEIFLSCHTRNDQLFLEIKNPYEGIIEFENGCPKASDHREGIGTKSIALIVEKHGGLYRFETKNGMFILNVIL